MKKEVTHQSIIRPNEWGGHTTTTLCGRMDNSKEGGWNVGGAVTCKHCVNASKQSYGKKLIEQYGH